MDVQIEHVDEQRVAAVRHRGPYPTIGKAFDRLGQLAGPAGLFQPDASMVALFHDDPRTVPADELRSDAGLTVDADTKIPDGLTEQRIPEGDYAMTLHLGSYAKLPEAWSRLTRDGSLPSGWRRAGGVSYERYLNDPSQVPENELRTEIRVPVVRE